MDFLAGSSTATITVDPLGDADLEANETVILTVTAGAGYTVGTPNSATGTILNDDNARRLSWSVTASAAARRPAH